MGLTCAGVKLRSMWRTESVDTTVLMLSLDASRPVAQSCRRSLTFVEHVGSSAHHVLNELPTRQRALAGATGAGQEDRHAPPLLPDAACRADTGVSGCWPGVRACRPCKHAGH